MVGMLLTLSASCIFPLGLNASLPRTHNWLFSLTSASCLGRGLLLPWLMADSCLCKLSLQLIFVTLSWSTTIALSFLELAEEDCFWHAYVFHPCDAASPAQLHLKQDGLCAGQAGCLEDFCTHTVTHTSAVLPVTSAAAPEARWTLCWARWLSWGLLYAHCHTYRCSVTCYFSSCPLVWGISIMAFVMSWRLQLQPNILPRANTMPVMKMSAASDWASPCS